MAFWAARQAEEVESLCACYFEEDELRVDPEALESLQRLAAGSAPSCEGEACSPGGAEAAPVSLSIRLRDEAGAPGGVRLAAVLPWGYPSGDEAAACAPVVWLEPESGAASAEVAGDAELCAELQSEAAALAQSGEECLLQLATFAEDLVRRRLEAAAAAAASAMAGAEEEDEQLARALLEEELEHAALTSAAAAVSSSGERQQLGRRAMFSHHIIAPSKRQAIAQWAHQLRLGGLAKIGWPGVIIVEGDERDVRAYVEALSRLRWKHFVVRGEQIVEVPPGAALDAQRALPLAFEEFGEDGMSAFAARCRQHGPDIDDLFRIALQIPSAKKQGPKTEPGSQQQAQRKGKRRC